MYYNDSQKMRVNGLYASINTPEALKGEEVHNLPPYSPCSAHVVDEYEDCPSNWMHGSDKASSYFVPVEAVEVCGLILQKTFFTPIMLL